jgi:putative Mg2+ transporter-C (MgtC) family protein
MSLFDLDPHRVFDHLVHLAVAFALAFPLGWERGRGRSSGGFRTLPVVAIASCGYALLARDLPGVDAESQTRLIQGVAAGIGFVGGGAILKGRSGVKGLVTAASIWNTGAIGIAIGFGRLEIAVVLAVLNMGVLVALTPLIESDHTTGVD